MSTPSRYGRPRLFAILILFLSFFNLITSSPLPADHGKLIARKELISQERYEAFLKRFYQNYDKYLFYTSFSYDQLQKFMDSNPGAGYESYKTMIDGPHWPEVFNEDVDEDDAEAASRAMATLVTGDVLVFGAVEWKKMGSSSTWTNYEVPRLKAGLENGRVKSINHMIRDATDRSQVLATDDGDKNTPLSWKPGHSEGETNRTPCVSTKRSLIARDPRDECEAPQQNPSPPPPKGEPKSLRIISVLTLCEHPACDSYSWKFMEGKPGTAVDLCGKGVRSDVMLDGSSFDDKFPNGEYSMRFAGYAEDCRYQGLGEKRPGGDVGWLHCPERPAIKCMESPEYSSGDGERNGCNAITAAYCDWE
jgi:hypothetical protein